MSCARLSVGGSDFECPECGVALDVEWDTEYGDPLLGQHDWEKCPACDKRIGFECWTEYRPLKQDNPEVSK